jgi:hypothetical protein
MTEFRTQLPVPFLFLAEDEPKQTLEAMNDAAGSQLI